MELTKKRLKNMLKDAKTLGCSAVALVVDTLAVPVDMCRDVVNKYQKNKEVAEIIISDKNKEETTKPTTKSTTRKKVVPNEV